LLNSPCCDQMCYTGVKKLEKVKPKGP